MDGKGKSEGDIDTRRDTASNRLRFRYTRRRWPAVSIGEKGGGREGSYFSAVIRNNIAIYVRTAEPISGSLLRNACSSFNLDGTGTRRIRPAHFDLGGFFAISSFQLFVQRWTTIAAISRINRDFFVADSRISQDGRIRLAEQLVLSSSFLKVRLAPFSIFLDKSVCICNFPTEPNTMNAEQWFENPFLEKISSNGMIIRGDLQRYKSGISSSSSSRIPKRKRVERNDEEEEVSLNYP